MPLEAIAEEEMPFIAEVIKGQTYDTGRDTEVTPHRRGKLRADPSESRFKEATGQEAQEAFLEWEWGTLRGVSVCLRQLSHLNRNSYL